MTRIPLLNGLNYKIKPVVNTFKGVNNGLTPLQVDDEHATEMQNLDSRQFPVLNVRSPRSNHGTVLTTIRHIGYRQNDYLTVVDGTTWKYWNGSAWVNILTGLAAANAKTIDFMDNTILSNGTNNKYWDGSTSGDIPSMPPANFLTVHANRLYAASKDSQSLKFSALRKYNDWTTVDDSGEIVAETREGEGASGLTSYANHVIFFKEHSMHELYGTGPMNYTLQVTSNKIGCISDRTIKEVQGRLYWLGYEGVYCYSGGSVPQLISFPVQGYINRLDIANKTKACAGTDGERYYLSLPIYSGNNILLVFDTRFNEWFVEDASGVIEFVEFNNVLYGATTTQIKKIIDSAGTESISWYRITKPFNEGSLSMDKNYYRLFFSVDLPIGSTLQCALSTDVEGSNFTTVKTFTASNNIQNQIIDIPLTVAQNADWVRVKLSGTGPCTIHAMERQIRIKPNSYA